MEAFNPWFTQRENKSVEELTAKRNLLEVAGSDVHRPNQIFAAYTGLDAELDIDSVMKALKKEK